MKSFAIASRVLSVLKESGYESYFNGGCVRDRLLGKAAKDFDIATAATPDQVRTLFPKTIPVGVQFGVILVVESGVSVEVATFRTEGLYTDGRRPDAVEYTDLASDAKRRDFTINGLYWDGQSESVIDLVGGLQDLKSKTIRTIGSAAVRFDEDHLRMLRAIRFSSQLGFEIEPETFEQIKVLAPRIQMVSAERVRDELSKMLTSPRPADAIRALDRSRLLEYVLPEVSRMKGVEQPAQYHPEGDVFVHTMMLLDQLNEPELVLGLAALLHDIAKPLTFVRAADRIRFHGHDRIGAEVARKILKKLCFPNDVTDLVCNLVAEHLRFKDAMAMRLSKLKRFLSQPRFDLHLELHRIDCLASHGDLRAYEFCRDKLAEFGSEGVRAPKLVGGADLIALGLRPGPRFTTILREVEDAVLEGKLSSRQDALEFLKKNYGGDGV